MPSMTMSYPSAIADLLFYHALLAVGAVLLVVVGGLYGWRRMRSLPPTVASELPERPVDRYRRWLAWGLGGLWLLDGLLQAQPLMVTRFIGGFLVPLLGGQPGWLQVLIQSGIRIWGLSPIWWNVLATYIQVLIGVGLLVGRDGSRLQRSALWTSVGWGVVVWIAGEAMGSLFNGGSILTGTPGSVFLYGAAALMLLAPAASWERPAFLARWRYAWAALWGLWSVLQIWPGNGWWAPGALASWVGSMAAMSQPAVLSAPLYAWAHSLAHNPVAWNAGMSAVLVILTAGWVWRPASPWVVWGSLAALAAAWYFGQDFGVLGGMGTDPNTGAIALLLLGVYGRWIGVLRGVRVPWIRKVRPSNASSS
jgi:hypothetical protein